VLDTETISSFSNGLYLDWKVAGNLLITITNQGPANAVLNGVFLDSTQTGGGAIQLGAASSVNTVSPSSPSMARAAMARGSRGGLAIVPAAGPVDAVLGTLPEYDDAPATAAGSSIHDLAMERVSEHARAVETLSLALLGYGISQPALGASEAVDAGGIQRATGPR
jgi:hypothetical protein